MVNKHCNTVEKRIFCKIKSIFVVVLKTFICYHISFIGARGVIKWGANELTLLISSWALLFPIWAPSKNVRFLFFKLRLLLKNNNSSTNALMARQERDFSPFERLFSLFERKVSAVWAQRERLKCAHHFFGVFERDVSAKQLDMSATRLHLIARWS